MHVSKTQDGKRNMKWIIFASNEDGDFRFSEPTNDPIRGIIKLKFIRLDNKN